MTANGPALLVRGGQILTADGTLREADVLVEDGRIVSVGHSAAPSGAPVLAAEGKIVAPGLVNAHMHSGENYNPGRYENLPLDLWFVHSHQVTRTEPPTADEIYVRTALGAAQMLRSGTTTAVDFVYEAPEITPETLAPVVEAYRDSGLRATILLGVADMPFLESLPLDPATRASAPPEAPPPSLEQILETAEAAVERWHDPAGPVAIGLGPSAPQRCSPELLDRTMELAEKYDLVWHTHVLETKSQAYAARLGGESLVELLHRRGLLGRRTAVVHAIWLSDRDIELLSETRTTMIHCLLSNLRLGDGIARLPDLRDAGVPLALGTDGRGCDETLDMFELMKMAALVHKARGDDYARWPTAREALGLATVGGSRPSGRGEGLGRMEAGAFADFVLLERRSIPFTPLLEPVRQLVYGAPSRHVRSVVVGGRIAVMDGELVGLDLDRVLERAERYAAPLADSNADRKLSRLEEIVRDFYQRAERVDVGVNGYISTPAVHAARALEGGLTTGEELG